MEFQGIRRTAAEGFFPQGDDVAVDFGAASLEVVGVGGGDSRRVLEGDSRMDCFRAID